MPALPNKVVALRNGTMGFTLAGHTCDSGKDRRAPLPSAAGLDLGANRRPPTWRAAMASSASIAATLDRFRAEAHDRTLYLFDVRDPAEYAAGHVAGARVRAGRTARAGDRPVCRHARRPHRALRRRRGARRHDRRRGCARWGIRDVFVLARSGQRDRPADRRRARGRAGHRICASTPRSSRSCWRAARRP